MESLKWLGLVVVVTLAAGITALAFGWKPQVSEARPATSDVRAPSPSRHAQPSSSLSGLPTMIGTSTPVGTPDFQAGMNLLLMGPDPQYLQKGAALLARIGADHVNSVAFAFPIYMDGRTATVVQAGANTPSDDELAALAELAHRYGMAVMFRPLMDEKAFGATHWRGDIVPSSITTWFQSYTALLSHYAQLAQAHKVEALVIGGEFDSMEPYTDQWLRMIRGIRAVYHGKLIYAANVTTEPDVQLSKVGFWSAVDDIGADLYPSSSAPVPATAGQIMQSWQPLLRRLLATVQGRPFVITEIGVRAQQGAHQRPWIWDHNAPTDQQQQAEYYLAACSTFADVVRGMYWWNVDLDLAHDPSDFNPLGNPAERHLRECFARKVPGIPHLDQR